jgi:hypothetical protein
MHKFNRFGIDALSFKSDSFEIVGQISSNALSITPIFLI